MSTSESIENGLSPETIADFIEKVSKSAVPRAAAEIIASAIVRSHERSRDYDAEKVVAMKFGNDGAYRIDYVVTRTLDFDRVKILGVQVTPLGFERYSKTD